MADQAARNELGSASAHLIVEAGVIPGISCSCRCSECRMVAVAMAEAGYLDRVTDRWWEHPAGSLTVWRFDDSVVRSHVIAYSKEQATDIFDRVMGKEYRDIEDVDIDIFQISGDTVLPIDVDESGTFVSKTASEWIEHHGAPCFL